MKCHVIVAGGRDFIPTEASKEWLIKTLREVGASHIVCGCASGADSFGEQVGIELGLVILRFPAKWAELGRKAGFLRNISMSEVADVCILFPGGKGTEHMRKIALKKYLMIIEKKNEDL